MLEGLLGLVLLVLDIYAIFQVLTSASSVLAKVLWTLLIVVLPFLGLILWFFLGPRGRAAA